MSSGIDKKIINKLKLMARYIDAGMYDDLADYVLDNIEDNLISLECLRAARVLKLNGLVIYLATLGVQNHDDPVDAYIWLTLYQAIGKSAATSELLQLPAHMPVKWAAAQVMGVPVADVNAKPLDECVGVLEEWLLAFELLLDFGRNARLKDLLTACEKRGFGLKEWLLIAKVAVLRYEKLKPIEDASEIVQFFEFLRAQLPDQALFDEVRDVLNLRIAYGYFNQNELERVKDGIAQVKTDCEIAAKINLIAVTESRLENYPEALKAFDDLIELSIHPALLSGYVEAARIAQNKVEFTVGHAEHALRDLQALLTSIGKKVFLMSGTLLGYVRNGSILHFDKDIDVGLLEWEDQYEIVQALYQSGIFKPHVPENLLGEETFYFPVFHLPTGVGIDIFIYKKECGKLITAVRNFFGFIEKFEYTPFELVPVDFLGTRFYIPDDADKMLRENFGNWRVPDPDYASMLEAPSLIDKGGWSYQLRARASVLLFVRKVKPGKLWRVLEILQADRAHHYPGQMSDALLDKLLAVHAQLSAKVSEWEAEAAESE